MKKSSVLLICLSLFAFGSSSTESTQASIHIRINQVGYLPTEQKVALALTSQNLSGQSFRVVKSPGGITAFTATVGTDRGAYGNFAHLYELNFTSLKAPGRYSVQIAGNASLSFQIGSEIYAPLLSKSLTFFKVQRCGDTRPLKHAVCHLNDSFAAGGWHDAGDYLKFSITTAATINLMLTAYDRHPTAFPDANHNGTPDVLDESIVGLEWIYKMWDPSRNTLYYQVGDESDHSDWRLPDQDDKNGIVRKIYSCKTGKGANVAGKTAASLALAFLVWNDSNKPFANPQTAQRYLTSAIQIYEFGKKRPAVEPGLDFYTENSWRDDMALAAIELYRATRQTKYLTDARAYAKAAKNGWTVDWSELNSLAHYEIARADASYRSTAVSFLKRDLESYRAAAVRNPFRAALPSFYWGSAAVLVGQALEMLWYEDLSGDSSFRVLAQQQRDYVLGGNPWGVCWVNGVGAKWSKNPHHQIADIAKTQLVGFWNEGPDTKSDWKQYNIQLHKPDPYAAFQTDAAVYHDDVEDYVTNEPTIFANGIGIALTSWFRN